MTPSKYIPENLSSAISGLKVKSALNPGLWLVFVTGLIGFGGLLHCSANPMLAIFFMCFAGLPLLCVCVAFVYFTFKKTNALQSEEFQLKEQTLRIIATKNFQLSQAEEQMLKIINITPSKNEGNQ